MMFLFAWMLLATMVVAQNDTNATQAEMQKASIDDLVEKLFQLEEMIESRGDGVDESTKRNFEAVRDMVAVLTGPETLVPPATVASDSTLFEFQSNCSMHF